VPFVATSVDQLRVGDEVEANNEGGYLDRGVIHRIEAIHGRDVMIHFGGSQYLDSRGWYFDPSPHLDFTRTWTVLNRDLEPASSLCSVAEDVTPRPGDRIALVRRREGVVREVGDDYVRFEGGGISSRNVSPGSGWTQTIEIIERSPEPLTDAEKLAAIKALIEEDAEWAEAGAEVSCAGHKVTDDGCYAATLAAKIADVLK
jgi:hypothetical protein